MSVPVRFNVQRYGKNLIVKTTMEPPGNSLGGGSPVAGSCPAWSGGGKPNKNYLWQKNK